MTTKEIKLSTEIQTKQGIVSWADLVSDARFYIFNGQANRIMVLFTGAVFMYGGDSNEINLIVDDHISFTEYLKNLNVTVIFNEDFVTKVDGSLCRLRLYPKLVED